MAKPAAMLLLHGRSGNFTHLFGWCRVPHESGKQICFFQSIVKKVPGKYAHSGEYYITILTNSKDLQEGDVLRYVNASKKSKFPESECVKKRK